MLACATPTPRRLRQSPDTARVGADCALAAGSTSPAAGFGAASPWARVAELRVRDLEGLLAGAGAAGAALLTGEAPTASQIRDVTSTTAAASASVTGGGVPRRTES